MKIQYIEFAKITPDPEQPRKDFDDLSKLSASIMKHGLISPIEVLKIGADKYQIIDGERRFKASAKIHNAQVIACIVKNKKQIQDKLLRQLVTTFHKKSISQIEKLDAIKKLRAKGYSKKSIQRLLDISPSSYYSIIKLDRFNKRTKKLIRSGEIPAKIVNSLSNLDIQPEKENEIISEILQKNKLNKYQIEDIVQRKQNFMYNLNAFESAVIVFNQRIKIFTNLFSKSGELIDDSIKKSIKGICSSELYENVEKIILKIENIQEKLFELKEKK